MHPAGPPDRLRLEAIGEEWAIVYRPAEVPYVSLVEDGVQRLLLSGATDNAGACRDVLCRWLRRKAEGDLVPWLREVATEHGFRFSRAAVRSQRTRWASFCSRGTVSLNLKLLFLPPDHVRYVLLHELCHSVHPNHSASFGTSWSKSAGRPPDGPGVEVGLALRASLDRVAGRLPGGLTAGAERVSSHRRGSTHRARR